MSAPGAARMLAVAVLATAALTAAPTQARERAHLYAGHTSQRPGRYGAQRLLDNDVSLTVAGGRVLGFTISWLAGCIDSAHGRPDAPLIDRSQFDPLPLRGGRFSIHDGGYQSQPGPHQRANVTLALDGVVAGRKATGTLSVRAAIDVDGVYTSDFCATPHPIRWRASLQR